MPQHEIHKDYLDTLYLCMTDHGRICKDKVADHVLLYIMSGKMTLQSQGRSIVIKNGEAVLVRRNHLLREIKEPGPGGEPFKGLFLHLRTSMLKKFASRIDLSQIDTNADMAKAIHIPIPSHPFLSGLFHSLDNYFSISQALTPELVEAKLYETVLVLLQLKPEIGSVLFDFCGRWKPSLHEFMEQNFMCDLTIEQFAHYTGRSLSTFKRDFTKAFGSAPRQWLTKRRLEMARQLIERREYTPNSVYLKVGFKNISHFYTAFKREYGVTPSALINDKQRNL